MRLAASPRTVRRSPATGGEESVDERVGALIEELGWDLLPDAGQAT